MYDMLKTKVDRLAGKMDFVKQPVQADMNLGFLTLRGAVCQTIGTRSTCRLPLKTLGYNGSN